MSLPDYIFWNSHSSYYQKNHVFFFFHPTEEIGGVIGDIIIFQYTSKDLVHNMSHKSVLLKLLW